MHQNGPQRDPFFLSNNPQSHWTEKVDPKEAEKGSFKRAVALGWTPKPGTLLPECSKMDPKGIHFFCPITPRVIGQKKWAQRGPKKSSKGCNTKKMTSTAGPQGLQLLAQRAGVSSSNSDLLPQMFLDITGTPALGTHLMHDTPDSIKSNSGENQIFPVLATKKHGACSMIWGSW